ncbi:LytR/AlgR family response regulator transcription factor [Paenibacillus kandeliae]|uniref:LytR/AlgR family response regulator transcription factor n=1 Tax=Paenibacillus kandeliae TaxID=3231269 RepID=UPI00345AC543
MLKTFIVEDEPLARDELIYLLKRSKKVQVIGEADNLPQAWEDIVELEPELVFLDIGLAEHNGLELAQRLMELDRPPAVIFATAFDEYALQAFDLNALDYILKPFDERRIRQALDKLLMLKQESAISMSGSAVPLLKKLAVSLDDRIMMLDMDHIVVLASKEGKMSIHTTQGAFQSAEPLTRMEQRLDHSRFVRVHRNYIVNLSCIMEIQPWFNSTYLLLMSDDSRIPVSRNYVKTLRDLLGF